MWWVIRKVSEHPHRPWGIARAQNLHVQPLPLSETFYRLNVLPIRYELGLYIIYADELGRQREVNVFSEKVKPRNVCWHRRKMPVTLSSTRQLAGGNTALLSVTSSVASCQACSNSRATVNPR
jgi:hypothetical protein